MNATPNPNRRPHQTPGSIVALALLLAFAPNASGETDTDAYAILAEEQRRALSDAPPEKFATLLHDFFAFRALAAQELSQRHAERFSSADLEAFSEALLEFGDKDRGKPPSGSPVFHSFHGHWRGQWLQDGAWTAYDHTWGLPENRDGIVYQNVEIGEWDGERRVNPIPAINTYSPANGRIAGAVGLDANDPQSGTDAPHWGIYLDEKTLIWIARFGPRDEAPYYSLYFEQIIEKRPLEYRIRGIGFNWDRQRQRLVSPHWKEGRYHPAGAIASEQSARD